MLLHTSFKLNLVITVKITHTLHWLYIELYEESVVLGVVVFKTSMLHSPCLGVPLAKVGMSANFGILVCKASQLYYLGVHLPGDLPTWALMVNIWNCHSDHLADLQGVDLPGDLLNFWQDRVDPTSTFNMHFMGHKMVAKMFPSRCRFQIYFWFCST